MERLYDTWQARQAERYFRRLFPSLPDVNIEYLVILARLYQDAPDKWA